MGVISTFASHELICSSDGGEVWAVNCSTSSEKVSEQESGGAAGMVVSVSIDVDKLAAPGGSCTRAYIRSGSCESSKKFAIRNLANNNPEVSDVRSGRTGDDQIG